MTARLLPLFAALSLLVSACGGITPQSACEQAVEPSCEKMWNCPGAGGLKIGSDLASCKSSYKALCALSAGGCGDGKTFDATAAQACPGELRAQTCEQFAMGQPASCSNFCK
jgi:hypothetical protein